MYRILKFDLARNALKYLIKEFDIKEIYIPYYLCDVIRHAVAEEKCKPLFYHIDDNFYPAEKFPKESFILYPNYFGICGENTDKLASIYPKLIVDNAHAYYLPPQGFACFNAEHKFKTDVNNSYLYIKEDETVSDNVYPSCPKERIDEFENLHKKYGKDNNLTINFPVLSPFIYPFLASTDDEADLLAEKLTKEGKTIYRYWNSLPKNYNEYKFYRRLVPIPLNTNK